jgi:hypothetical protein
MRLADRHTFARRRCPSSINQTTSRTLTGAISQREALPAGCSSAGGTWKGEGVRAGDEEESAENEGWEMHVDFCNSGDRDGWYWWWW